MSGLTDEDRELLGDWWDTGVGDAWGLSTLYPAVEQIVTRHLEAAATAIEAAIDAYVTTAGLPTFIATNTADAERTGRLVGLSAAARIVRDHQTPSARSRP